MRLRAESLDENTWAQAKLLYIGLLTNHKQPECAETFFNSVSCRILDRTYFHNEFIFLRPAISTEYLESDPPAYRTYYPTAARLAGDAAADLRRSSTGSCPFADLDRDIGYVLEADRGGPPAESSDAEPNFQIQVLASVFYRNKAAYVMRQARQRRPRVPVRRPGAPRRRAARLYLDTMLARPAATSGALFSLTRAYFMVDMEVPSAYVAVPADADAEQAAGRALHDARPAKQGKTLFYRDLAHHLRHSRRRASISRRACAGW